MPGTSGNLVVKSKLPPPSGPSLEAVEPHPLKGALFHTNCADKIKVKSKLFGGRPRLYKGKLK